MHVSSGFLLLEIAPGHEGRVLDELAKVPGVTHRNLIFPAAIAVKVEAPEVEAVAGQLKLLEGVLATRFYRARNA